MKPYKLSAKSLAKLATCHPKLLELFQAAITNSPCDFGVSHGHRTPEEQHKLWQKGRDESGKIINKAQVVTYKDGYKDLSKHNKTPSEATDIFILDERGDVTWDAKYYIEVAEHIKSVAKELGITISWGGDWKTFKDYPHYQI